ncbi:hypothetical protein [Acinetobacter stercoris]|uniref:Uncharacterized protein n=1 Tax=Acinetobacter stercoris TaxID=2126983 RepID=A0A2U3N484_9GAMM|nr:hypothetical protein [Acinetobacter stercoris]SPL72444.1 hypothetical protein KPC_3622 [Acinetobacter stercoris]
MSENKHENSKKGTPVYLLKPDNDFRKVADKIIKETIQNPKKNPLYVIAPVQISLEEKKNIKEEIVNKYKTAANKATVSVTNYKKNQSKQKEEDYENKGMWLTEMQSGQKAADLLMNSLAVIEDSNVRVFDYEIFKRDFAKGKAEFDKKYNRSKPAIDPNNLVSMQIQKAKQSVASTGAGLKKATANQARMYHPPAAGKGGGQFQGGTSANIKVERVGKAVHSIGKGVGAAGTFLDSYEAATYFAKRKPAEGTAKVASIGGSMYGSGVAVGIAGKVCPKMVKGAKKPVGLAVAGLSCFGVLWYAGDKAGGDIAEGLIMDMVSMTPEEKKEYHKRLEEEYGVGMYEEHTLSSD